MRHKIFLLLIAMLMMVACDGYGQQISLEVSISNVKSDKGTIRVGLFKTEKDFLKTIAEGKVVKSTSGNMVVVFENLPAGEYGLSIIHDENENGELDSNMLGIPKEGFAFGNNAMGNFGPPSFDEAKIVIGKETVKQAIKLKYL